MAVSKILIDGVGIDLTNDTCDYDNMLAGVKAHMNDGEPVTGAIPSKAAATYTPSLSAQTISAGQYLSGKQTISAVTKELLANLDADFVAGNIKKDVDLFGLIGTFEGGGGGGQGFYVMSNTPSSDSSNFYTASVGAGGSDPIFNDILNAIGGMPTHFAFIDESGYVDYASGKKYVFGGVCGTIIDSGVAIGMNSRLVYRSSSTGYGTTSPSLGLIYNNTSNVTVQSTISFNMKGGRTYKFFLWR